MRSCAGPGAGKSDCRDGYVCRALHDADGGVADTGICFFDCNNDPHGACGNAPCKPDGYCDL
jgi:hypothetical protein